MNQEAREHLDSILALELEALTEAQMEFLKARRGYLTEEQRGRYGLGAAPADTEDTPAEDAEAPRARRGRKAVEEAKS